MGLIDFTSQPPATVARGRKSWVAEALPELRANAGQWGRAPVGTISSKQRAELKAAGCEIRTGKVDGKTAVWLMLPAPVEDDTPGETLPDIGAPVPAPSRAEMAARIYSDAIKRRSTDAIGEVATQLGVSRDKAGELIRQAKSKRGAA